MGKLIQGERRFNVVLRVEHPPSADPYPMSRLRVPLDDGRVVLLGDAVDIVEESGPAQVSREQAKRRVWRPQTSAAHLPERSRGRQRRAVRGVVLLSAVRQKQRLGLSPLDATLQAADERLRPVITTALVAALGFLPMALASGTGAEVQRPLATVVIGGLVTATLTTLISLPALYARFGGAPATDEP